MFTFMDVTVPAAGGALNPQRRRIFSHLLGIVNVASTYLSA